MSDKKDEFYVEKKEKVSARYLFKLARSQNGKLYGSVIFGVLSGGAMFVPFYAVYRVMLVLFGESDSSTLLWGAVAAICIFLRFFVSCVIRGAVTPLRLQCAL